MLKKLMIANRGEIAIRVARTARSLGIATVGVHTADDASSLHVKHMDQMLQLPQSGVPGYLDIDAIVGRAAETGCDALHPGYGLLSERPELVQACAAGGITFVGPSAEALAMQGDKVRARALAQKTDIPVIQGFPSLADAQEARAAFDALGGKPMMLKAVHGGGGRGMRVVKSAGEAGEAFEQCRTEATAAFGEGAVYAERFLPSVRHIEVQILGDGQDVTHLWERDCSLQRRHQKVIELAPAPGLNAQTRRALLEAAIRIGTSCNYSGLGTVEFLVETEAAAGDGFYFIETNPRIQVEHTVTEEITGLDLVELQLHVAAGETLADLGLDRPPPCIGSAVQLRVNTERFDADGHVVPTGGTLTAFAPPSGPGIRVDGYGYSGYRTNPNFDSLLAKVIVHDRSGNPGRLFLKADAALSEFHIAGVETNLALLRRLVALPELADWSVNSRSLDGRMRDPAQQQSGATRFFEHAGSASEGRHDAVTIPDGTAAVRAPMQAAVCAIPVAEGDQILKGQEIALIEAMKMQHVIVAGAGGIVVSVPVAAGDVVAADDVLIIYAPNAAEEEFRITEEHPDPDHIRADLALLNDRVAKTLDENRPKAVQRRRGRGQRTTRENIADLCEGGDFHEYGQLLLAAQRRKLGVDKLLDVSPADGIVTGLGEVNADRFPQARTQVAIMAYDSTVMAGTQGFHGHYKTDRMVKVAQELGLASIFLTEGGGGRPNDDDFADIVNSGLKCSTFSEYARLRGWGPKITVNSGYCFAGNAAVFGIGDFRIATRNSWIGLGGPAMIEAGGLGAFHPTEIGPASLHAQTGLVDILADNDMQAMQLVRRLLTYFQGDLADWTAADQRELRHIVPENRKRSYMIRPAVTILADTDSFLELGAEHADGIITGLLRIEGRAMAVIANNPQYLGGALDAAASTKAARFLALCSQFRIPVLSLCDTPGFMVGPESERQGAVGAATDFIRAGACLKAPLFFVCLRKGYGIGAQAMAGGSFDDPVFTLSWPTGEFGPMGLEGAIQLGYRKELDAQPTEEAKQTLYDTLVAGAYEKGGALNIASLNEVDAVIDPADTRGWIAKAMRAHKNRGEELT